MYCKKCKYHSFDHVNACPKCGTDWEESRKSLYLNWITSTGFNWLSSETLTSQAAPATAKPAPVFSSPSPAASEVSIPPVATNDYLDAESLLPPHPPIPTSAADTAIDIGMFPDLDFGLSETQPAPQMAKEAPKPAPESSQDMFLDDLAPTLEPIPELDFSSVIEPQEPTPEKPAPKAATKRDDLFIPELEEMLAPLTDDYPISQPKAAAAKYDGEDDIILDFGPSNHADDVIVIEDSDLEITPFAEPKK